MKFKLEIVDGNVCIKLVPVTEPDTEEVENLKAVVNKGAQVVFFEVRYSFNEKEAPNIPQHSDCQRSYRKHEYCKSVECPYFKKEKCIIEDDKECPFSAKEFHKWIQENKGQILIIGE